MPTYVFLTRFTQQGIENIRDSPDRTEHAKTEVEPMGGTWKGFFVPMGQYDGLVIAEFLDDIPTRSFRKIISKSSSELPR